MRRATISTHEDLSLRLETGQCHTALHVETSVAARARMSPHQPNGSAARAGAVSSCRSARLHMLEYRADLAPPDGLGPQQQRSALDRYLEAG